MQSIGSAEQAIAFALTIDDHFDMRAFLQDWQQGLLVDSPSADADYFEFLRKNKAEFVG